jgi:hypothetical protein
MWVVGMDVPVAHKYRCSLTIAEHMSLHGVFDCNEFVYRQFDCAPAAGRN